MKRKFDEFKDSPFSMYYGTEGDKNKPKIVFFVFKFSVTYNKFTETDSTLVRRLLKDNINKVITEYKDEILTNSDIFPFKDHLIVNYKIPKDFFYNGNKPKQVTLELTLRTSNVMGEELPLKSKDKSIYQGLYKLAEFFIESDFFSNKSNFKIHKIKENGCIR